MNQFLDDKIGSKRNDREFDEESFSSIKNVKNPLYLEEPYFPTSRNLIAFPRDFPEQNYNQTEQDLGNISVEKLQLSQIEPKKESQVSKKNKEQSLLTFDLKDQNRSQLFEELSDYFSAIFSPLFNQNIFFNSQLGILTSSQNQPYKKFFYVDIAQKRNFVDFLVFESNRGQNSFQKHREFLVQLRRYADETSSQNKQKLIDDFLNKYINENSIFKNVSEVFQSQEKSKNDLAISKIMFLRFRNKLYKKCKSHDNFYSVFYQQIQKLLQFQIKTIIENRQFIKQIEQNLQKSYKKLHQKLQETLDNNLIPCDHILFNCKTLTKTEKLYIDQVQEKKRKKTFENIRVRKISNESLNMPSSKTRLESQCQICTGVEEQDFNQIIYCCKCSLSAHQNCLGLINVSKFQWTCQNCKIFGPLGKYTRCLLCPCRGGVLAQSNASIDQSWLQSSFPFYCEELARCQQQQIPYINSQYKKKNQRSLFYNYFDQTFQFDYYEIQQNQRSNRVAWIHYICGKWNKIPFSNGKFTNIENSLKYLELSQQCYICEIKQGVCLKCDHYKCQNYFHAECGRRANLHFSQYKYNPFFKAFCSQHLPLKISQALKQLEIKKCRQIQKYHYLLKKLIRSYKDDFKQNFRNSLPIKLQKREKQRRKNSMSQNKKNKKIIDDVNDIIKSMQYNIVIDLTCKQGNFYVQNILKREVQKKIDLERDSKLWKILAKKKHQNPNYLYSTYMSAIKYQKIQSKTKKSIRISPVKKHSPYNINLCDYCQSKSSQKPLWRCDFCNKVLHLKCLKYEFSQLRNLPNYLFYCRKCKKRYRDRRERKRKGMELQVLEKEESFEQGLFLELVQNDQVQLCSEQSPGQSRMNMIGQEYYKYDSCEEKMRNIDEEFSQTNKNTNANNIVLDQSLFTRYQLKIIFKLNKFF